MLHHRWSPFSAFSGLAQFVDGYPNDIAVR
jgi:hypothetical protein